MRDDIIEHFIDEGLIEGVIRPLRHGKEASVELCRANRRTTDHDLLALKIFHPLDRRDFRDESLYRQGEFIKERRVRVALEQKTKFGRQVQGGLWVARERETLRKLESTPVPAPRPVAATDEAILMTYIGDVDQAAPRLQEYRADESELEPLWDQLLSAVGTMLFNDVVHGDLSPFNVLVWEGRVTVIDFPQAVDPKKNQHAEEFLARDVQRVGAWFQRFGFEQDWETVAGDLWASWTNADLIPPELRSEMF
ncbi:MAG TPA: RIO1 family regulatory kinase/ATPase [Acidimicrobiia bacterium]|nr:RIO1 family regulatory kinase/ATPase [Acidimicrobiia bacterium]